MEATAYNSGYKASLHFAQIALPLVGQLLVPAKRYMK